MYFKNGNRRLKSYSAFVSVVAVFYSGLFLMHFSYYEHKPTALPTTSTPCHREQLLRQITCPQKLHVFVMKKLKSAVGNVVSQSKKKGFMPTSVKLWICSITLSPSFWIFCFFAGCSWIPWIDNPDIPSASFALSSSQQPKLLLLYYMIFFFFSFTYT